jgi:glyoxylase-like metal-dependent hydrolase (beta-lactamase superfamily II)
MDNGNLELLHVQGNAYMISGAGGNVTVQIGDSDVMVVDPGLAQMSDKVVAAIRALTDKPIFFIVDTSMDEDHTSGNANLSKAGWALPNGANIPFGHDVSNITGLRFPPGASIISHINALDRMSAPNGQKSLAPQASWPTDVYDADDWRLYNGEEVYIYHLPAAHTDGDSVVLFRRSAVVSTGDLFTPLTSYPVIEEEKGGSIDGFIDGLNQIIEMLVPEDNEEGGTYVIPGHGRVCDRNDVVNFRDMVTIIRGRIDAMIKEGMTLEQVKAAKPTVDYDGLGGYRATKDQFIGAVYRDLSRNQQGKKAAVAGGER